MAQLAGTEKYWRDWLAWATIADHSWRPYIERSALALKALSYAPTGAVMAAGTTSLPESPGGERNWDYRYTWIRDTAFHAPGAARPRLRVGGVRVLRLPGRDRHRERQAAAIWPLQIMYGIGGETDLAEHTLDHLSGYRNSRPVRIGNGAFDQHQHDVWGMLLDAVAIQQRRGGQIQAAVWEAICLVRRPGHRAVRGPRPGHLGDAGRPEALRRLEGHVLGRGRPGAAHRPRPRRQPAHRTVGEGGGRHAGGDPRRRGSTTAACSCSTTTRRISTRRTC